MRHRATLPLLAVAALFTGAAEAQIEPLEALDYAVVYDPATQVVRFDVTFNRYPDFMNLDPESNSVVDAFQFYLDTLPGNNGWGGTAEDPWETIVRGSEIRFNNTVRIRDHTGPETFDPESGHWGPLAGEVAYTLVPNHISFEVPFSMLNTPDGVFTYELDTFTFGAFSQAYFGQSRSSACRADWDGDGQVNVQDFLGFLGGFAAGAMQADINDSGAVDIQDFLAYLQLFAAGC
jgi:hypothetical protein